MDKTGRAGMAAELSSLAGLALAGPKQQLVLGIGRLGWESQNARGSWSQSSKEIMGDGSKGSAGWQTALAGDALSSAAQRGSVTSPGGCWLMGTAHRCPGAERWRQRLSEIKQWGAWGCTPCREPAWGLQHCWSLPAFGLCQLLCSLHVGTGPGPSVGLTHSGQPCAPISEDVLLFCKSQSCSVSACCWASFCAKVCF